VADNGTAPHNTPANDQQKLLKLIGVSFANAAKKAAYYNDTHGHFTPIGIGNEVRRAPLNKLHYDLHTIKLPFSLKKGFDSGKNAFFIAGANGAGKSTLVGELYKNLGQPDLVKLSADVRTVELRELDSNLSLHDANILAARQIDGEVFENIKSGNSFLIETVLSTDKYQDAVIKAKNEGYQVNLIYVSVYPRELSPARVALRRSKGGHDVDPEKAMERYDKSHKYQAPWFAEHADFFAAFDNSAKGNPVLAAFKLAGGNVVLNNARVNPSINDVVSAINFLPLLTSRQTGPSSIAFQARI